MAEQPAPRSIPRPTVEPAPRIRPVEHPSAPMSDPDVVSRPVMDNSEHTLEQALVDTPEVVRCECANARCDGHYRKSFCIGVATKGLVPANRPDDPMTVLCDICYGHTLEGTPDAWTDVPDAITLYLAADDMHLDPDEEVRRASRLMESARAARSEGTPATPDQRSEESVRAAQAPQRDTTVPVLDDSYQTTSQIPVLDPPEEKK